MICNVEVWRTIDKSFPDYEVSNKGRVRSWKNSSGRGPKPSEPRILSGGLDSCGYPRVAMMRVDGKKKTWFVHRAVLTAFVGPAPDGMQCCHADHDRTNNSLENLRWGSPRENTNDRLVSGKRLQGEACWKAKLTDEDAMQIATCTGSRKDIAKRHGVSVSTVNQIKNGAIWSHVTGIEQKPANWLLAEQAVEISMDKRRICVIAKEYGVSPSLVCAIKNGRRWSSVTGIKYQPKRRKVNV